MTVAEAYEVCRRIARREAKNFFYAFVVLPAAKRDAICAVYAFMRHADDLSDDESVPVEQRRANLKVWLEEWHITLSGASSLNPVFLALRDAQMRFQIAPELLDQLVEGTAMDLERVNAPGEYETYATFEDLYHYCYLVASVVGLVCIRIFGYTDTRAEKLAEETGIAFQLTNILRDVREDVERGRVYLPLADLARNHVTVNELAALPARITENQRKLFEEVAARAEKYYESGWKLLPLIEADSRPALWVLISIYHRLLRQIEEQRFEVFAQRAGVPVTVKTWILARGMAQIAANRVRAGI